MTIPFKVKLLTPTAKTPEQANLGDLWDIFADGFCTKAGRQCVIMNDDNGEETFDEYVDEAVIEPQGRILIKTGMSLELPKQYRIMSGRECPSLDWLFTDIISGINAYAVADLRPRSGLALKHGITVLNAPATIDNSYRKEIGVILINHGHEPYTIKKGDKIAQMLIRPLYPSEMEIVDNIEDTGRGAYGSTGK